MSYPSWQLAKALTTATTHQDAGVRAGAQRRAGAWQRVLQGIRNGSLTIGSRTPVAGLPAWVTPEVVRGGFVTGDARAAGRLEDDELARARRLGIPATREALFASFLTDDGLAELGALLDSGDYEVRIPEDAALLVVAVLARAGRVTEALALLDTLKPFSGTLRFMPRARTRVSLPPGHVHRSTAGQVREHLATRRPNRQVETQREALSVWLPLTDRFVAFWEAPGEDTLARARELVDDYDRAVAEHTRCTKYRNPKQNLPILVAATRALLAGEPAGDQLRRVGPVLAAIHAKRGPSSGARLAELRAGQEQVAAQPSHARLAQVAAARVEHLPADTGIVDVAALSVPVDAEEAERFALQAGAPMPAGVERTVRRARTGTPEELLAAGVVPSAEVLAELVPALTGQQIARSVDGPGGTLLGASYQAFRRRRSLLLLDLAAQVQFAEIPWVRALHGGATADRDTALAVAQRIAGLALDAFPGTILPNPLIAELQTLYREAGLQLPLTEEIAADIFMGRFSRKYQAAARVAATHLRGSVYERYYGLDFEEVLAMPVPPPEDRGEQPFDRYCRTAEYSGCSVAGNGTVIERQQVLTTHNLAVLVFGAGVRPARPWADLVVDAGARTASRLGLAQRQPWPLPTLKDAAYAWRQALFHLTQVPQPEVADVVTRLEQIRGGTDWPMVEVLGGLKVALAGRTPQRPLLGWTTSEHWAVRTR